MRSALMSDSLHETNDWKCDKKKKKKKKNAHTLPDVNALQSSPNITLAASLRNSASPVVGPYCETLSPTASNYEVRA